MTSNNAGERPSTLCLFDASGIQSYVYGSNELRHNIGASGLVDEAFRVWLRDAVRAHATTLEDREERWASFVDSPANAFIITEVGGSASVAFKRTEDAYAVMRSLGETVLSRAPGLRLVMHAEEWSTDQSFAEVSEKARQGLTRAKRRSQAPIPATPGIVARCTRTDEPAAGRDIDRQWRAASVLAKAAHADHPDRWLNAVATRASAAGSDSLLEALRDAEAGRLRFSAEIDRMRGRKGESSFIGVIHIDGDGIGALFRRAMAAKTPDGATEIELVKSASRIIDIACADALAEGVDWVRERVTQAPGEGPMICGDVPLYDHPSGGHTLPFRPIVAAGDDITIVTEGAIALDVAAAVTRAFERAVHTLGADVDGLDVSGVTVSCGVGLGRAHQPFFRLYELAETATQRCKEANRQRVRARLAPVSALAWQFLETAQTNRTFAPPAYALHESADWHWDTLRESVTIAQRVGEDAHASLKRLGAILATPGAPELTTYLDRMYERRDPALALFALPDDEAPSRATVFDVPSDYSRTRYADVIDLMDFCIRHDDAEEAAHE